MYPFVKAFYQGRAMPNMGALAAMQVLRATAFAVAVCLLVRDIPDATKARWISALALFSVGVLSLIVRADNLPMRLRFCHTLEMLTYYPLFGYLLAVWFGPRRLKPTEA